MSAVFRWFSCESPDHLLHQTVEGLIEPRLPSNKAVLNATPDLPLLYLFNQLVIAVILLHAASFVTTKVQIPKLEIHAAKKLTPVVTVNIVGLVFNTLCLRGVEASFFQIARGMVLPLTILVSCVHTHARPSVKVLIATGVVTVGFLTGISPNKDLPVSASPSVISLIYGLLSSFFIAVHAVLIKASLPHCNNSTIELAYWTNLGSAIMLAPFVLLNGEVGTMISLAASPEWDGRTFVYGSAITGVFGFLLCVAGLLSIKITSPITHMFSSVSAGRASRMQTRGPAL
jgi:GDP-fucose transporter C1